MYRSKYRHRSSGHPIDSKQNHNFCTLFIFSSINVILRVVDRWPCKLGIENLNVLRRISYNYTEVPELERFQNRSWLETKLYCVQGVLTDKRLQVPVQTKNILRVVVQGKNSKDSIGPNFKGLCLCPEYWEKRRGFLLATWDCQLNVINPLNEEFIYT